MNPLSIVDRARSGLEKILERGIRLVFRRWRPKKPVNAYEEYRCRPWTSWRTDGGLKSERNDFEESSFGVCAGLILTGFDCTGSGGRVSTVVSDEVRRTWGGLGIDAIPRTSRLEYLGGLAGQGQPRNGTGTESRWTGHANLNLRWISWTHLTPYFQHHHNRQVRSHRASMFSIPYFGYFAWVFRSINQNRCWSDPPILWPTHSSNLFHENATTLLSHFPKGRL